MLDGSHLPSCGHTEGVLPHSDAWPADSDCALGAGFGESYRDNAVRELEEEMGVKNAELEELFDFWFSNDVCRLWGRLFRCVIWALTAAAAITSDSLTDKLAPCCHFRCRQRHLCAA